MYQISLFRVSNGIRLLTPIVALLSLASAARVVHAQVADVSEIRRAISQPVDSGWITPTNDSPQIVFSAEVTAPGADWIRLAFDAVVLPGNPVEETASQILLTAARDGAVQALDRQTLRQWNNASAYFNGDTVNVELIASASSGPVRIRIAEVWVNDPGSPRNTCGETDDRVESHDVRVGRALPIGCTAWLINDANRCLLSAGHCAAGGGSGLQVIEFNVPLSNANGNMNHPPPESQFAVDLASLQTQTGGTEIGNDWSYFGCYSNSTTGLTAFESQGAMFELAATTPPADGRIIRKTGFGTVTSPVSGTLNLAQKTLAGPLTGVNGTIFQYPIDSSGGDSGSPVFQESDQRAVAIHTNGGCTTTGVNSGCSIHHPDLQQALANPLGACIPTYLDFSFPNGRPEPIDPFGTTAIQVSVVGRNGYVPADDGAVLHVDVGAGFSSIEMTSIEPGVYEGVFPAAPCGTLVSYYITCETLDGHTASDPRAAPAKSYSAIMGSSITTLFSFDFETAGNWGVSNTNVIAGGWERGIPQGDGARGDPTEDFDGSGQCFVTGLAAGDSDLDGGPTRLISAPFGMASASEPYVRYARWFSNDDHDEDRLDVEVSNNFGVNWTLMESVSDNDGWMLRTLRLRDFVPPTSGVRLRFNASDQPNNSTTEAGIDAVVIFDLECPPIIGCMKGDTNFDGVVDGLDAAPMVQSILVPPEPQTTAFCAADMDESGTIGIAADIPLFVSLLLE